MGTFAKILLIVGLLFSTGASGQVWNLSLIDNAGSTGYDSRTLVTDDGVPYVVYYTGLNASSLVLAKWVDGQDGLGGWDHVVLDDLVWGAGSLGFVMDSDGRFHIAWSDQVGPPQGNYGIWDPTLEDWVLGPEVFATDTQRCVGACDNDIDLVLVGAGATLHPALVYENASGWLKFAERDPDTGDWSTEVVEDLRSSSHWDPSLAVDSQDCFHVSYYEELGEDLKYATKCLADSAWGTSTLDHLDSVGKYSSILVDENDDVHVVYYDETNGDLKYATSESP